MAGLVWGIIVILFVLWLLGFLLHFGGGVIHILIVIAIILVIYNLVTGRGARALAPRGHHTSSRGWNLSNSARRRPRASFV